jgi:hypothetical protein
MHQPHRHPCAKLIAQFVFFRCTKLIAIRCGCAKLIAQVVSFRCTKLDESSLK